MAYTESTSPEASHMYWMASYPQPVVAPLCFGVGGIREGTAVWGQSFNIVPVPSPATFEGAQVSDASDWAQMCVPVQWHCATDFPSAAPFAHCIVPPTCCSPDANFTSAFPQALAEQSSTMSPFNPAPFNSDECPIAFQPLQLQYPAMPTTQTYVGDEVEQYMSCSEVKKGTSIIQQPVRLQAPMPVPGDSQRWADIVDEEEPGPQVTVTESQSSSAARRRRRQRTADVVQESVADAPMQQSMEHVKQNDEFEKVGTSRTCIQKLADWVVAQMGAGGSTREATVAKAHHLATSDKNSCRAMQLALESAPAKDAVALALGLRGHVRSTIQSMHGNYVLQKIIEVVPSSVSCFIAEELVGIAAEVSRHRFGCRVLCRLLEHLSPSDLWISSLIDEVLMDVASLCRHTFGNYVVQHILEFGLADQQHVVVSALSKDLRGNARNQYASHGIEKALSFCSALDRDAVLEELFQDSSNLLELAEHQFGCYVIRALLKLPEEHLTKVEDRLRPIASQLGESNRRQRRIAAGVADRAAARSSHVRSQQS